MTYSLTTQGTNHQGNTFEGYSAACEGARMLALSAGVEVTVVHDETEASVYATSPTAIRVTTEGGEFDPWTRIEVPQHQAPAMSGWVTAYQRKRIAATVYRSQDERPLPWMVHDGISGGFAFTRTTKEMCKLTKEMGQGRRL